MRDKLELSRSSWLVCLPVIGVALLAGAVCAFFGQTYPAAALIFLALTAGGRPPVGLCQRQGHHHSGVQQDPWAFPRG